MKSTRICFPEAGKAFLDKVEIPELEPNGMLVENLFSMISTGTELAVYTDMYAKGNPNGGYKFPAYMGYAAISKIIDPQSGEQYGFKKGDIVFNPSKHGKFDYIDPKWDPTFDLVNVINDFEKPELALFARFGQIAISALRVADFAPGDHVIVFGMGLIGNLAGQLFRVAGGKVLAVDLLPERRELAEKCGMTALDPSDTDFIEKVRAITGGKGAPVVVDATGVPAVINSALKVTDDCGQVILLGSPRGKAEVDFYADVHTRAVSVIGCHERVQRLDKFTRGGKWQRPQNTRFVLEHIRNGNLIVEPLITDYVSPEDCQKVYDGLAGEKKNSLGVIFDWRNYKG